MRGVEPRRCDRHGTGTLEGAMQVSGLSRWKPMVGLIRARGLSARRPRSMGIRAIVVGAIVVGTASCGASASSTFSSTTAGSPGKVTAEPSAVSSASTSYRGVTAHSINVVFPEVSLNSLAGQEGFAEDAEYGEQTKAIELFVK